MNNYFEEEVSNADLEELGALVRLRLQRYPSVELFSRGTRMVLRTWRVKFNPQRVEVEDPLDS